MKGEKNMIIITTEIEKITFKIEINKYGSDDVCLYITDYIICTHEDKLAALIRAITQQNINNVYKAFENIFNIDELSQIKNILRENTQLNTE